MRNTTLFTPALVLIVSYYAKVAAGIGIRITPPTANLTVKDFAQLKAIISPFNVTNKNVTWLSSDPVKATVAGN